MAVEDAIKVVVDYGIAPAGEREKVDTGGFRKIFQGEKMPARGALAMAFADKRLSHLSP